MRLALTFDDGPTAEWTPPILDLLAAHDAKATFFVCGWAVQDHPELVQRTLAEGHEVGNHTMDHPRLTRLYPASAYRQLELCQDAVFAAARHTPNWWRAPYLDVNPRLEELAWELGLRHVGADIDTGDWFSQEPDLIFSRVDTQLGDQSIVLLHDGKPPDGGSGTSTRQPTVDALERILGLDAEFVTVGDL